MLLLLPHTAILSASPLSHLLRSIADRLFLLLDNNFVFFRNPPKKRWYPDVIIYGLWQLGIYGIALQQQRWWVPI